MLAFRRLFSTSGRYLKSPKKSLTSTYTKLFKNPCFQQLEGQFLDDFNQLEPYEFSKKVNKFILESNVPKSEQILAHNSLIEELTQHEYAVATVHIKELEKIGGNLSLNGFVELVKNNPGRVASSWDILMNYYPYVKDSEIALLTVLQKVVFFDAIDVKEGKKELSAEDLTRALFLLSRINDKATIENELWQRLTEASVKNKASIILLKLLDYSPLGVDPSTMEELTDYQFLQLCKGSNSDTLRDDKDRLVRLLSLVGTNDTIEMTEQEVEVSKKIEQEIWKVNSKLDAFSLPSDGFQIDTSELFENVVKIITQSGMDKQDVGIAKLILRCLGIHKGDTKRALELYHSYLLAHPGHADEVMYEMFLSFIYQSYLTSNRRLLSIAQTLIPQRTSSDNRLNILRALILANSKFSIDEALEIFNENVQELKSENDPATLVSPAGLLSESLILAYLVNKDRDFAHVIFDGAAREKILSGATAIKRVKKIMTTYGDALEKDDFEQIMEQQVLNTLKTL